MKAYCSFSSEILDNATYDIQGDNFSFTKKGSCWCCEMSEVAKLIKWIDKAIGLPIGYNTPPIKVKGYKRIISITKDENHICLRQDLMEMFLEELKSVYEVYG